MYPRLWRFAFVLTRDRAKADDLAQATVARAIENASRFAPGTALDRWLFVMARRLWLNELRATRVRTGAGLVSVHDLDLPADSPDPVTNILASQVLNSVMALPEAQRMTVMLVYVEGYTYREAAEFLQIPIGTVMSRLSAARATIRESAQ